MGMKPPTLLSDPYNFMVEPLRVIGPGWPRHFDAFFNRHYIYKTPDSLLLACEDPNDDGAWLVWWAEHYPRTDIRTMLRAFLRAVPYYKPRIRWARPEHGRINDTPWSTDRLFRIAGLPIPAKQQLTGDKKDVKDQ